MTVDRRPGSVSIPAPVNASPSIARVVPSTRGAKRSGLGASSKVPKADAARSLFPGEHA
jgi:hypothetical protein